jgi:hypothetical protein
MIFCYRLKMLCLHIVKTPCRILITPLVYRYAHTMARTPSQFNLGGFSPLKSPQKGETSPVKDREHSPVKSSLSPLKSARKGEQSSVESREHSPVKSSLKSPGNTSFRSPKKREASPVKSALKIRHIQR